MHRRRTILMYMALLAASLPLLVFAYSGTFSRLSPDDFGHLGKALESGAWESMRFWREQWNGDYSNLLFYGILAPFGVAVAAYFPMVIIVIGFAGLAWLMKPLCNLVSPDRQQNLLAAALAALTLTAVFHGFQNIQTLFWLSATVEYSLPSVNLIALVALAWAIAGSIPSRSSLATVALAAAIIAFINAGFSEMFMVFQILFLSLLLLGLLALLKGPRRKPVVSLCLAGLLGSLASLPLQLSSPGIRYRASLPAQGGLPMAPIQDPAQLFARTLEESLQLASHQPAFAGFMLAFAGGMLAALALSKGRNDLAEKASLAFRPGALALIILAQLAFAPILWNHTSDSRLLLGRFSAAYFSIIVLNAGILALFVAQFVWRRRIAAWLNRRQGSLIYYSALLLAILLLFALSQFRSVHWRAASYLFASAVSLIVFAAWQLTSGTRSVSAKKLRLVAVVCSLITALTFAGLVAVQLWGIGGIIPRVFAPTTFLLMVAALTWGLCLGHSLGQTMRQSPSDPRWRRAHIALWLVVALMLGAGIAVSTAQQIELRAAFAAIWDEQHHEILRLRAENDPSVHTMQVAIRLSRDPEAGLSGMRRGPIHWRMKMYYGLDYEFTPHR